MNIKKLLDERGIELKYIESNNFPELEGSVIITNDDSFTRNLLLSAGFEKFYVIKEASLENIEAIEMEIKHLNPKKVAGFGGGRAIDTAKKVSFDLEADLISIPTAPSHDGLVSRNCSLYAGNKKISLKAKYPKKLIIPLHLWKSSGDLKKAGICDILSNFIALQDISLAEKNGKKFSEFYKNLSFEATKRICWDEKKFSEALIISGIAMEESSVYCSGSEHEIEKLLEMHGFRYLHGQLVGTGILISAKVYSIYYEKFQGLRFNSRNLFKEMKELMIKQDVYKFALQPLFDEKFKPEILRKVSKIRPERYNLWNAINSEEIDWNLIIDGILKN